MQMQQKALSCGGRSDYGPIPRDAEIWKKLEDADIAWVWLALAFVLAFVFLAWSKEEANTALASLYAAMIAAFAFLLAK